MKKFDKHLLHDYNHKNSLFQWISEFHYFSELLDNNVDAMLLHPWIELQGIIKEKWLTQKAFSILLWKKVSEVNELLKWKRNITIQWDYTLHKVLWTPIKYRILKQVDYEYSLLNIEKEPDLSPITIDDYNIDLKDINNQSISTEIINTNTEETKEVTVQEEINPNIHKEQESAQKQTKDSEYYKRADIFRDF